MSQLATLRSRLSNLRRRRWAARSAVALGGLILAALWILIGIFVLDWTVEPYQAQRLVLLIVGASVLIWAFRRFSLPWLGQRETELDMALLVERQQKIDSDLVAALQFESPQAEGWGSRQLEQAVIDYVAEYGQHLDAPQGFAREQLVRRFGLLAVTTALVAVGVFLFPAHARAFFNRLLLGSAHYPTRTTIERIAVNGSAVFPESAGRRPKSPQGAPLEFEVHAAGELPLLGRAELKTLENKLETTIELRPDGSRRGLYRGKLPRLVDSVSYQLYLGDAWTDPAVLEAIPLPVVDLKLDHIPPDYAGASQPQTEASSGARQIAVLEGSRVTVHVTCLNKPLRQATMAIGEQTYPLVAQDRERRTWSLSTDNTPLELVVEPLKYEIQVVDDDGLGLERPIQGYIRIKADRQPRISADLITRRVLPAAKPKISYDASDDYGIAQLRVHRQIARASGGSTEEDVIEVPLDGDRQKLLRGRLPLELSSLKLVKGDELKITLEAVDYRGALQGKSALSEPLVLEVTDERGVLAAMMESDERLARQLDAVIERQVGIGDTP